MKNFTLVFFFLCSIAASINAQTIFVFSGNGDWTDAMQWDGNNAPGTTIVAGDAVEITGTLTIPSGTSIINNGTIESFNTATTEPTINILGSITNNGTIDMIRTDLTIESTGSITSSNMSSSFIIGSSSLFVNRGNIIVSAGTMRLVGTGLTPVTNNGTITIGVDGTLNLPSGTFDNKSASEPIGTTVLIDNSGTINMMGTTILNNRGEITNNGGSRIIGIKRSLRNLETGTLTNAGLINVEDFGSFDNDGIASNDGQILISSSGSMSLRETGTFANNAPGLITIESDGDLVVSSDTTVNSGNIINNGTLKIDAIFTNLGTIVNDNEIDDDVFSFGAELVNSGGILAGINTKHDFDFSNAGTLAPGNAASTFGIYKFGSFTDYTQEATGVLEIEIGGTIAGNFYDQVTVGGNVTTAGTLNVSLVNGFEPAIGDSFTIILQQGNISGTFDTVNLPNLPVGKLWDDVSYSNTEGVVLTVISDPLLSVTDVQGGSKKAFLAPNPSNDITYINGIDSVENIEIYDVFGQQVKDYSLNIDHSINMQSLSSGVYLIYINNSKALRFLKK